MSRAGAGGESNELQQQRSFCTDQNPSSCEMGVSLNILVTDRKTKGGCESLNIKKKRKKDGSQIVEIERRDRRHMSRQSQVKTSLFSSAG